MAGPVLTNGDNVMKLNADGLLKLGRIFKYGEIDQRKLRSSSTNRETPLLKILWDGHRLKDSIDADETYKVYDRSFYIGQEVQYGSHTAQIVDAHELVIVQLHNKEKEILSSPIHIDDMSPVTKLFVGVHVELNGWIGVITEVNRNLRVSFKKNVLHQSKASQCFIKKTEPITFKLKHTRKRGKRSRTRLFRRYPFITGSNLLKNDYAPFKGKLITFHINELKKYGNWLGENPIRKIKSGLKIKKKIRGRIMYYNNYSVSVNWFKSIPSIVSSEEKPAVQLMKNDFRRLKFFHVNPKRYVDSGGICMVQVNPDDTRMSEAELGQHYWNMFQEDNIKKKEKNKKGAEKSEFGQFKEIQAVKHFSFHIYRIQLEDETIENVFGRDLTAVTTRTESKVPLTQFPGIFYVSKADGTEESNEYGVVLNMTIVKEDIICKVQWLQTFGNGIQELNTCYVNRNNLLIHKKFNDFRPGAIVYKSQVDNNTGFYFGNICSIARYNFGKVLVYCPIENVKKQLWPHQLEVLKLDS